MSRIYRPRDRNERIVIHEEPPTADLLREVRHIERRRTLLDVRDAVERVPTTNPDRHDSWRSVNRSADDVKTDILAALRALDDSA